jgi:hypothetical protein
MYIAEGKASLDDCDMLSWSLGCTGVLLPSAVPAREDLVAGLIDQPVDFVGQLAYRAVCVRGRLFEDGVGRDHLARHEIFADAEVLEHTLGLSASELVGLDLDLAKAVDLGSRRLHGRILTTVSGCPPATKRASYADRANGGAHSTRRKP